MIERGDWGAGRVTRSVGMDETDTLEVGAVIDGRYELVEVLGVGGVGVVYRAQDQKLERSVALKVLKAQFADHETMRPRFEREARTLASLMHPNLVLVIDYGLHDSAPYIVMELLAGRTLRQALAGGPLTEEMALSVVTQLLQGLAFAHDKGIVHRDITPGNVFLLELPGVGEQVKILDFGFAKILAPEPGSAAATGPALTTAGTAFGTPPYMAPEQVAVATMDTRTDVYAVGVILFEMLAGVTPFAGETPDVLRMHLVEPMPAMTQRNPEVEGSEATEALLRKALEKQPEKRFADAAAMVEALQALPRPWMRRTPAGRDLQAGAGAPTPVGAHDATIALDSADLGSAQLKAAGIPAPAAPPPTDDATKMLDSGDLMVATGEPPAVPAPADMSRVDMDALAAMTGAKPLPRAALEPTAKPAPEPAAKSAAAATEPAAKPAAAPAADAAPAEPEKIPDPAPNAAPVKAPAGRVGPRAASAVAALQRYWKRRARPQLHTWLRRARPQAMRLVNAVADVLGPLYDRARELARKKPAVAYGALALMALLVGVLLYTDDDQGADSASGDDASGATEVGPSGENPSADGDLWATDREPAELQRLLARLHEHGDLRPEDVESLRRLSVRHPDDARPHLLLGALYMGRGWHTDALKQYRQALEAEERAREDVHVLGDLLLMAQGPKLGSGAAATIVRHYGEDALPAVDEALKKPGLSKAARARLEKLRDRLARSAAARR